MLRLMKFSELGETVQAVFEQGEQEYMDFSALMLDTANDKMKKIDGVADAKGAANAVIRKKFAQVLGVAEDEKNRKVLRKAIRRHQTEVFELLEETLENLLVSGWGDNPFFMEWVDQRNLADGDQNVFYVEEQAVLTVSRFSGNHHDLIRQKLGIGESFSVTTDWYGIKIYEEFELFMAGRRDFAAMITKVYEAFDRKINDMIYESFMGADEKLPTDLKITGKLEADKLIEAVQNLETDTGKEVVICGTRSAISQVIALSPSAWISDDMRNERHTTGTLGQFEGIRLMAIPQVNEQGTRNKKLDNKKLLLMPIDADNKPIKLVNEGEAIVKQVNDGATNQDMTYEYELMQKLGINVVINQLFGTYKFTVG